MRSLGATARACALEGQACIVVATFRTTPDRLRHDGEEARAGDRLGAVLELPIAPSPPRLCRTPAGSAAASAATLARLQAEVVIMAGIARPTAGTGDGA